VETNEGIVILIMKYFFCCDNLYWTPKSLDKVKCPICHKECKTKFIDVPVDVISDPLLLECYESEFNVLGIPEELWEYTYVIKRLFEKNDLKSHLLYAL